jgi:hypothetical protein
MHPTANYIRFSLAKAWDDPERPVTPTALNEELKGYGLMQVDQPTFDRIRTAFNPPENFRLSQKTHVETVRFMKSERLYAMWQPDDHLKRTLNELLGQKMIVEKAHILLMGDIPSDIIAERLNKKFRINPGLTKEMVDYYRHYFWNVRAWDTREWEEHTAGMFHGDWLTSSLLCGPQQALYRAGFTPRYDPKMALRDTHRQLSYRIQVLGFMNDTKNNIDLLCKLSREERALYDRLYGEGSGLLEQAKEVRRFMIEHKSPDVVSIEKLIADHGGTYGNEESDTEPDEAEKSGEDKENNKEET